VKSGEHFLLTVPVVGAVLGRVDDGSPRRLAALAAYGLGLGVLIDLDHFVLARLRVGDWRHLIACLREPKRVFTDQEHLFDGTGEMAGLRVLSHVLIGGVLVVLARRAGRPLGVLTAAVLYTHVLADLLRDHEIV
jgi:hypothetical protein